MVDIKFQCSSCRQSLEAPVDMSGQVIDCPTCHTNIRIPRLRNNSATSTLLNTEQNLSSANNLPRTRKPIFWIFCVGLLLAICVALATALLLLHSRTGGVPRQNSVETKTDPWEEIVKNAALRSALPSDPYERFKLGVSKLMQNIAADSNLKGSDYKYEVFKTDSLTSPYRGVIRFMGWDHDIRGGTRELTFYYKEGVWELTSGQWWDWAGSYCGEIYDNDIFAVVAARSFYELYR